MKVNTNSPFRIKQLAKSIQGLARRAVIEYSREVDMIIVTRCKERHRIERTLDGMLDFCFDKNMLELYRKLCRYYYEINPAVTVEYVYAYRDMWESPPEEIPGHIEEPARCVKK